MVRQFLELQLAEHTEGTRHDRAFSVAQAGRDILLDAGLFSGKSHGFKAGSFHEGLR